METGKNKEQFEKWRKQKYQNICLAYFIFKIIWRLLPPEMQLGVRLKYYDSLEITIETDRDYDLVEECITDQWSSGFWNNGEYTIIEDYYNSRPEAHAAVFKKANELINQNL